MNVSLTSELESMIHNKVRSGLYGNASEVVREALRLLAAQDQNREAQLQQLRADIRLGMDQVARGEGQMLDPTAIKAQARARQQKK